MNLPPMNIASLKNPTLFLQIVQRANFHQLWMLKIKSLKKKKILTNLLKIVVKNFVNYHRNDFFDFPTRIIIKYLLTKWLNVVATRNVLTHNIFFNNIFSRSLLSIWSIIDLLTFQIQNNSQFEYWTDGWIVLRKFYHRISDNRFFEWNGIFIIVWKNVFISWSEKVYVKNIQLGEIENDWEVYQEFSLNLNWEFLKWINIDFTPSNCFKLKFLQPH